MKSWVCCRGSMWIYWPRFFVFQLYQTSMAYATIPVTLLSCTAGVPMELARLMQKWKGHWRRMAVLFTQFIGWTTETEHGHRNKKDWLILALVLFGVSLSSLVFKPWPSMWHRVKDTVDGRNPAPSGIYKPCKWWDKLPINWCRISSTNSTTRTLWFEERQPQELVFLNP